MLERGGMVLMVGSREGNGKGNVYLEAMMDLCTSYASCRTELIFALVIVVAKQPQDSAYFLSILAQRPCVSLWTSVRLGKAAAQQQIGSCLATLGSNGSFSCACHVMFF